MTKLNIVRTDREGEYVLLLQGYQNITISKPSLDLPFKRAVYRQDVTVWPNYLNDGEVASIVKELTVSEARPFSMKSLRTEHFLHTIAKALPFIIYFHRSNPRYEADVELEGYLAALSSVLEGLYELDSKEPFDEWDNTLDTSTPIWLPEVLYKYETKLYYHPAILP